MMEGWKSFKLGELLEIKYGKDHKKLNDGKYPLYGSGGIMRYVDEFLYDDESILIPRKGTLTNLFYLNAPFSTVDTMFWSKVNKLNVFPKFLYYILKTYDFSTLDEGAAIPSLTTKTLNVVTVNIPKSKETQQKIASILSAYDDLIENNLKRIKLLEEMAQQTYEEWFVRMRFPGFEDVVIDVETGLPEGWEKVKLGEIVENFDSKRVPISSMKREKIRGVYPYYGAAAIMDFDNDFLFDGRFVLMGEDGTVITKNGTPMLQFVDGKFWVNNHAHVLNGTKVSNELLFCFLSQYKISSHITGSAQPKINQANLNRIEFILPSTKVLEEIKPILKSIFDSNFNLQNQNHRLKEARDILLPRLMSGMIEV
ncbi:hypothetical protein A5893_09635 [Pedobacter psychrophilus]|uniref:Type I restriction modification DNA specificity domain-containing protein n=1 Tax=Pedobacter psychrophilus TaxID=1826909 RepID=A0A179DFJ6_9SPHI|nr:restriction endonuclease subunit S [Pedobacter psychrophilus]OAQ39825.1 hypothetical protein A5893_09635 [Pedobacter psychrophilus]